MSPQQSVSAATGRASLNRLLARAAVPGVVAFLVLGGAGQTAAEPSGSGAPATARVRPEIYVPVTLQVDVSSLSAQEREMVGDALELGGTVSAEHGLGAGYKREVLLREHPSSTPLMRSLKRLLDPAGILTPGKIFPEESGLGTRESGV